MLISIVRIVGCALSLIVALTASARARLAVTTVPSPVILGQETTAVTIGVDGLPGAGPVDAAVNVGQVRRVQRTGGRVTLEYQPPEKDSPQILCLALWRPGGAGKVHLARIPLVGRRRITIRTRTNSDIVITVGPRVFGPYETGSRGRRKVRLLIPPGVDRAVVSVTDKVGLKTTKRITIKPPPYNLLTVIADLRGAAGRGRIMVASATPGQGGAPSLQLGGADTPLRPEAEGLWSAPVDVRKLGQPGATVPVKAWLPGKPESTRELELTLPSRPGPPAPPPPVVVSAAERSSGPGEEGRRRLRGVVAVGIGMVHNTGAFFSPRFSLEAGVDLRLPVGWLGLRLLAGVSWASQQIAGPPGLAQVESEVLVLPLGGAISYALPLSVLTPYATAGVFAQLVHSSSSAEAMAEQSRDDVVLGLQGLLGAQRPLGPGAIFLQAGFVWGQVETAELELLAGGVVVEAGFRLLL